MDHITAAKRPAEIVRNYIETKYLQSSLKSGARLPTIKEFSEHLRVGSSTVRSVLKSLTEEGSLQTIPGRGTFLVRGPEADAEARPRCLGINMPETLLESWRGAILLGLTNEALKSQMMVTALGSVWAPDFGIENVRKAVRRVDGVIAFPDPGPAHEIDKICEEMKRPQVHINPTHFRATRNFVSNDYFSFAYHLALAWRESGRRKIVLVTSGYVNDSVSVAQTYAAFMLAFAPCREARVVVALEELDVKSSGEASTEDGRDLVERYLKKHGPASVDAVYASGDLMAEGARQALEAAGRKIPEDVSLVGGTGMNSEDLVTMKQPMQEIGKAAVQMLSWRIENPGCDAPGVYLMPELGQGTTLRRGERQAYQRLLSEDNKMT